VEPVTFRGAYRGGFNRMRPSDRVSLTLSDDQVELRRHRTLLGLKRIWSRWSAVTVFEVRTDPDDELTTVELTTKSRGPGVIVLADASPDDVWAVLAQVPASIRLMPEAVREELGVELPEEPQPDAPPLGEGEDAASGSADNDDEPAAEPVAEATGDDAKVTDAKANDAKVNDAAPADEAPSDSPSATGPPHDEVTSD